MRDGFRVAFGGLLAVLVVFYGVVAWREAETQSLAAAEAEGRGLLAAVAAGVASSVDASVAVERLLAARLTDAARSLAAGLEAAGGLEEETLRARVEGRGGGPRLAGAALLDPELGLVASAEAGDLGVATDAASPFAAGRIARLGTDALVGRLRAAALAQSDAAVVGFDDGPFAARTEFAVAVRAPALPGFVVVRADATDVLAFRRDAGIARVLRDAAAAPGIASLLVQDGAGVCVAATDDALVGAVLPAPPSAPSWREDAAGRRTLELAAPVALAGGPPAHLRVLLDAAPIDAVVAAARRNVAVVTAAALAAGLAGSVALGTLERRRRAAEAALRDELARRERFATMGRLAAEAAHEIRGPLNALLLQTQLLVRALAAPAGAAPAALLCAIAVPIREAAGRVDAAVQGFLALGRDEPAPAARPTDLADVVRHAHASEGGDLRTDPPPAPVVVAGDVRVLATAVANLVRNARQAAPPETVRVAWREDGGDAVLDVDDGGPGVPAARRAEIFQPFRTSRADGVGLGLSLARDAVERHGGRIEVLDAPGGGARFRIRLPGGVS